MMKLVTILSLLMSITLVTQAQLSPKTFENDPIGLKQYTLPNGLSVFLSENNDQPQVYGMVVIKAGGKNDPKEATGIAHYLEHMLFKGTTELGTINFEKEKVLLDEISALYEKLGATTVSEERLAIQTEINKVSVQAADYSIPNELDKILSEMGGTGVNAYTTEDYTAYHNTFPANQIERWLEVSSHRFKNPVFRLFQSELETVYEEKNRSMDNVFTKVFEEFMKKFYKSHPYGQQTVLGEAEHLKNPSLDRMYEYYNKYYVANNMALILCGDFKSDDVIRVIEQKFGDWKSTEVAPFPKYEEKDFAGREVVKIRATPIAIGGLGFRGPAIGHEDEVAMEICGQLLSNFNESGLLDELMINNEINTAFAFPLPYLDYGAYVIFFVPKIIGQSLDKAEKLVLEKIKKLRVGEFEADMLQAVKTNLIATNQGWWESNNLRAEAITECFTSGQNWTDILEYQSKVTAVTKEKVVEIANKYFGDNYLLLQSKMGFPKKDKLEKPGFEPVVPAEEAQSEYYKNWKNIPVNTPISRFVDFSTDIEIVALADKVTLERTYNPFNNLFSLEVRYGLGEFDNPILAHTANYLGYVGTTDMDAVDFKKELFMLGAAVDYYTEEEEFVISVEGLDENLDATLRLVNDFLQNTEVDDDKMKKVREDLKSETKFSRREPQHIARALLENVLYKEKSQYLRELSKKELKALSAQDIVDALRDAQKREVTISYTGQLSTDKVKGALKKNLVFNSGLLPKTPPVVLDKAKYDEPTVFFVPKKKASQSQIYFYLPGSIYNQNEVAQINAYNKYFGGDMSSLVFQEIREFRSLAYSTWARYITAKLPDKDNYFLGFIGCQSDKTPDAISAMLELMKNMPQKPERMEGIKNSLMEEAASSRPEFRELADEIRSWKQMGYAEDPNKLGLAEYPAINFDHIIETHKMVTEGKNPVLIVVGNKKQFDAKKLTAYGKLVVLKEDNLFSYP